MFVLYLRCEITNHETQVYFVDNACLSVLCRRVQVDDRGPLSVGDDIDKSRHYVSCAETVLFPKCFEPRL